MSGARPAARKRRAAMPRRARASPADSQPGGHTTDVRIEGEVVVGESLVDVVAGDDRRERADRDRRLPGAALVPAPVVDDGLVELERLRRFLRLWRRERRQQIDRLLVLQLVQRREPGRLLARARIPRLVDD